MDSDALQAEVARLTAERDALRAEKVSLEGKVWRREKWLESMTAERDALSVKLAMAEAELDRAYNNLTSPDETAV